MSQLAEEERASAEARDSPAPEGGDDDGAGADKADGRESADATGAGASRLQGAVSRLSDMASVSTEMMQVAKAEAIIARNERLAKEKLEADELRKLHRDQDFYYLVNKIVENTIANMCVEASYGEFDTTRPPRQIVEL